MCNSQIIDLTPTLIITLSKSQSHKLCTTLLARYSSCVAHIFSSCFSGRPCSVSSDHHVEVILYPGMLIVLVDRNLQLHCHS